MRAKGRVRVRANTRKCQEGNKDPIRNTEKKTQSKIRIRIRVRVRRKT
jgi:hypothetical protein